MEELLDLLFRGRTLPADTTATANDQWGGNVDLDNAARAPYADTLIRAMAAYGVPTEEILLRSVGEPGMVSNKAGSVAFAEPYTVRMSVGTGPGLRSGQLDKGEYSPERAYEKVLAHELGHVAQNHDIIQRHGSQEAADSSARATARQWPGAAALARTNAENDADMFAALMEELREANRRESEGDPMLMPEYRDNAMRRYESHVSSYPGLRRWNDWDAEKGMKEHIKVLDKEFDMPDGRLEALAYRMMNGIASLFDRR